MQIPRPDAAVFLVMRKVEKEESFISFKRVILKKFLGIWCSREILLNVYVTHLIPKCYHQNMLIMSNAFVLVM